MKKLIIGIILIVFLAGCEPQITPAQMQEYAESVNTLVVKVDDYQVATSEVMTTLSGYGIVDANLIAKINKIDREIDRVQPQVASIATAITDLQLTGDDVVDWITMLRAANIQTTAFNPYAHLIEAGLGLATLIFGYLALKKKKEAEVNALKYKAHKNGVAKTMKEVSVDSNEAVMAVESKLYNNIGKARADLGVK